MVLIEFLKFLSRKRSRTRDLDREFNREIKNVIENPRVCCWIYVSTEFMVLIGRLRKGSRTC